MVIADEIAQRSHDIDDAFKSRKISYSSFMKYANIRKALKLYEIHEEIIRDLNNEEMAGMIFIDKNDMYRAQISSRIINLFIEDVVQFTSEKLKKLSVPENNKYSDIVVNLSHEGKQINSLLESIINLQVINSSEVAQFDKTASRIISKLFKYYYDNPLCLERTTLLRLYKEISSKYNDCINFTNGDLTLIREEFKKMVEDDLSTYDEEFKNEYLDKRKMLSRCIADHIGGMIDTYAINEYHKLYGTL